MKSKLLTYLVQHESCDTRNIIPFFFKGNRVEKSLLTYVIALGGGGGGLLGHRCVVTPSSFLGFHDSFNKIHVGHRCVVTPSSFFGGFHDSFNKFM